MKHLTNIFTGALLMGIVMGCAPPQSEPDMVQVAEDAIEKAHHQYYAMLDQLDTLEKVKQPRTMKDGKLHVVGGSDWTVGFFPGSLWYLFNQTKEERFEKAACRYTEALTPLQDYHGDHDIGFRMFCSFGNGLKYGNKVDYQKVIIRSAKALQKRFRSQVGAFQSWPLWNKKWTCPVIIDNMMNLELLFEASKMTGDSSFYQMAVKHANTTLKNHFRPDGSSFHVVDYDTITGDVRIRQTHQGAFDASAWARGQAWGLYGFTMCYRYTQNPAYLKHAEKIASFIFNHPNYPKDGVPYWDFNAPNIPEEPRDASAAAIMASALYELSEYVKGQEGSDYITRADHILQNLASDEYTVKKGENACFILKHSVGGKPFNSEVDVPLNYADYYYLEALGRAKDYHKKK